MHQPLFIVPHIVVLKWSQVRTLQCSWLKVGHWEDEVRECVEYRPAWILLEHSDFPCSISFKAVWHNPPEYLKLQDVVSQHTSAKLLTHIFDMYAKVVVKSI